MLAGLCIPVKRAGWSQGASCHNQSSNLLSPVTTTAATCFPQPPGGSPCRQGQLAAGQAASHSPSPRVTHSSASKASQRSTIFSSWRRASQAQAKCATNAGSSSSTSRSRRRALLSSSRPPNALLKPGNMQEHTVCAVPRSRGKAVEAVSGEAQQNSRPDWHAASGRRDECCRPAHASRSRGNKQPPTHPALALRSGWEQTATTTSSVVGPRSDSTRFRLRCKDWMACCCPGCRP